MKTLSTPIRIILADDHEIFRDGFRSLIESESQIQVVAEAGNGYTLVNMVKLHLPDVIITDIKMPGMSGVEATREIMKFCPQAAIIALTMFEEDHLIIDMLSAGAMGYLLKGARKPEIIEAIISVYNNHTYYCSNIDVRVAKLIANQTYDPVRKIRKTTLTTREKEVLVLICREMSNIEISENLGISFRTVEVFRKKLHAKTKCKNMAGLVIYAVLHGIYTPELTPR